MRKFLLVLGILLLVGVASADDYFTSYYPIYNNATDVKATSIIDVWGYPYFATNHSLLLTGATNYNSWQSEVGATTSQRFHIDLGSAKDIDRIYYENHHYAGGSTSKGVKNFTFWGSNDPAAFADTTYATDTNWTQINTSVSSFAQHTAVDAADPHYITTTPAAPYRYYAFKFANNYGDDTNMGVRRIELQTAVTQWNYTTAGTYTWTCPVGISAISLELLGGGGGGHGGGYISTLKRSGFGGSAGEQESVSSISVTPGTNYTITVGAKGVGSYGPSASPSAGGISNAFGRTANGGTGGTLSDDYQTGFPGDDGVGTDLIATNGTCDDVACGYAGGEGGTGYGAGGGGGGAPTTTGSSTGGDGAQGWVVLTAYGYGAGNLPQFSADTTTGIPGTLVHFTDESIISSSAGLGYNWSFGDGTYSDAFGDTLHVFSYTGAYDISLTLTATNASTVTEMKRGYIIITNEPVEFSQESQKYVTLNVKTMWGSPINNATVVMTPASTSTGDWEWLLSLVGVKSGDFNPDSTVMVQRTDMNGASEFYVLPTAKYDLNITAPGYTFTTGSFVPSDSEYTFRADILGTDLFSSGYNELEMIQFMTNGTELNSTHGRIHVEYTDLLAQTTSATVYINQSHSYGNLTNETTIASYTSVASGNFTHDFDLEGTRGESYIVRLQSSGTTFSNITRDFGILFKPGPVWPSMLPEELMLPLGMVMLFVIAFIGTRTTPGINATIIVFAMWIIYLLGWWTYMAPDWQVLAGLMFATVVMIFFNVMIRSKKTYTN